MTGRGSSRIASITSVQSVNSSVQVSRLRAASSQVVPGTEDGAVTAKEDHADGGIVFRLRSRSRSACSIAFDSCVSLFRMVERRMRDFVGDLIKDQGRVHRRPPVITRSSCFVGRFFKPAGMIGSVRSFGRPEPTRKSLLSSIPVGFLDQVDPGRFGKPAHV